MKKFFYKLIFPPFWVVIAFVLLTIFGMIIAISSGMANSVINYAIYGISFYGLSITIAFFIKNGKGEFKKLKTRVYNTKYGNRYFTDIDFKTNVSLYLNLLVNIGNIALNIIYGFVFDTNWFFILALYYATLTVVRFFLALYTRKNTLGSNMLGEWRRARLCAAVLTLINLSLTGVVLMMMYQNKGFTYAGILIYVMAAYSFYHVTVAIVELIKHRKYESPIINSVKSVKLAAALVSMLSLETAMLSSFGSNMPDSEKRIFIAATGAGISIIVIGLSSYMIVKSTNEINKLRKTSNE